MMGWFRKKPNGGVGAGQGAADVQELLARLDHADPAVRLAACRALGDLGGRAQAATERLQELFDDPDGDVCNAAADAYSRIERGF